MSRQAVHKLQCQFPGILEEYQTRIAAISTLHPELSAEKLIEQAWTECRLQRQHLPVGSEARKSSAPQLTWPNPQSLIYGSSDPTSLKCPREEA